MALDDAERAVEGRVVVPHRSLLRRSDDVKLREDATLTLAADDRGSELADLDIRGGRLFALAQERLRADRDGDRLLGARRDGQWL